MFVKIQSFLMAIYMLIIGPFSWGHYTDKLDVTYNIESGIYEYTVGDTFEVKITMKNNGHSFIYDFPEGEQSHISISVYQEVDGFEKNIWMKKNPGSNGDDGNYEITDDSFVRKEILVKRGLTDECVSEFTVGDGAPLGKYTIRALCYGQEIIFEDVITVK